MYTCSCRLVKVVPVEISKVGPTQPTHGCTGCLKKFPNNLYSAYLPCNNSRVEAEFPVSSTVIKKCRACLYVLTFLLTGR